MRAGSPGRAMLWGVVALILATIVLAPVIGVGRCADSIVPEESFCESYTQSLAGLPTSVWPWLIAVIVIVLVTAVIAVRRRGDPAA
ncbi:hypothetical protein [Microbacterium sp. 77mftsu3.1]|uniref:hypothetical protein n=1 Tax=Microbacterium sp. 77mftsu3.1 TaxID=1761802 RepID=UPI00088220EA|nr:hypothetical protein [Microbacterium sp. 77mftsu3.1]SDG61094.1 hypothetical protein SAMN04488590_1276 [Microbacterium sp. 77mftsu3.1]